MTVSGPHGSGKCTYAAKLAGSLGLRHVSAGMLFRKLAEERKLSLEKFQEMAAADPSIDRSVDERTMVEAERGDLVVDGQLAGWVLKEISDLRIFLTAPVVVRLERIAARDGISLEEARRQNVVENVDFHRALRPGFQPMSSSSAGIRQKGRCDRFVRTRSHSFAGPHPRERCERERICHTQIERHSGYPAGDGHFP